MYKSKIKYMLSKVRISHRLPTMDKVPTPLRKILHKKMMNDELLTIALAVELFTSA